VGLYWLTNRVLERPTILFGADMSRVLLQRMADDKDRSRHRTRLFVKTTLAIAGLSLPFLLIIAFGPELFSFVFGGEWHRAGEYARWMSLFTFVSLCALPAKSMTTVYGLQRTLAIWRERSGSPRGGIHCRRRRADQRRRHRDGRFLGPAVCRYGNLHCRRFHSR
jgi:O-antigen/teichoic acid export membrane protein